MTQQIATTPGQSKRILACGIDSNTADMYWWYFTPDKPFLCLREQPNNDEREDLMSKEDLPSWSLSSLLALLPKELYDDNDDRYYFSLAKEMPFTDEYRASYKTCWFKGEELIYKRDNCPIEACVQMIEWLTENNHRLNKI